VDPHRITVPFGRFAALRCVWLVRKGLSTKAAALPSAQLLDLSSKCVSNLSYEQILPQVTGGMHHNATRVHNCG
jgi:hypothetical protein